MKARQKPLDQNALVLQAPMHLQPHFRWDHIDNFLRWVIRRRAQGSSIERDQVHIHFDDEGLTLSMVNGDPDEYSEVFSLPFEYCRYKGFDEEVVEAYWSGTYDEFLCKEEIAALPVLLTLLLEKHTPRVILTEEGVAVLKVGEGPFRRLPIPIGRMRKSVHQRVDNLHVYEILLKDALVALKAAETRAIPDKAPNDA